MDVFVPFCIYGLAYVFDLYGFRLFKDLLLSPKHMDGLDMLFTCHWHDDYFESVAYHGPYTFMSLLVCSCISQRCCFLFISTSQSIQSWNVHLQFQLSRTKFTSAQPCKLFNRGMSTSKLRTTFWRLALQERSRSRVRVRAQFTSALPNVSA